MARPCTCDRVPECKFCTLWHTRPDSPAVRAWRGEPPLRRVQPTTAVKPVHALAKSLNPTTVTSPRPTARAGGCGACGSKVSAATQVGGTVVFDRVVLINLRRRPDRLAEIRVRKIDHDWKLPQPVIFPAVDGRACGVPSDYKAGAGAYGCMRSHLAVLEQAMTDGIQSLLVFEDDVTWNADTWPKLAEFLAAVPGDWDQLMLGGQHQSPPTPVRKGVVRCVATERTHAYAVRGTAIKELYHYWLTCTGHIDHAMGRHGWQRHRKVYAPTKFLFGQAEGKSDINGRVNPAKLWAPADPGTPLYHLTAPAAVVKTLRESKIVHTGYTRTEATDLDVGLDRAMKGPAAQRSVGIRKWAEAVLSEAAAVPGLRAACWYPGLSVDDLRAAVAPRTVISVEAGDLETAVGLLKEANTA